MAEWSARDVKSNKQSNVYLHSIALKCMTRIKKNCVCREHKYSSDIENATNSVRAPLLSETLCVTKL
jgi:hypothetical protein